MKHTSKNKSIIEDSTNSIDENIKTDSLLESDGEKIVSLNTLNETEVPDNNKNSNNYISYASNAYYYTGKSMAHFNIKAIIMTILGIIIIGTSTFFYFINKNNLNPFIGFSIGILLLIIALIQFIYKKN